MRYGLIGSVLLHIVIFGLVIFNFTGGSEKDDAGQPVRVAVKVMSPQEFSERQAGKAEGTAEKAAPPAEVNAPEAAASAKKEVEQKPSPKPAEKEAAVPPPPPPPAAAAPAPKPPEQAKAEAPAEKPAPKRAEKKPPVQKPAKPKPEPAKNAAEPEPKRTESRPFDPNRIAADIHREEARAAHRYPAESYMETRPSKLHSERQQALLNRDPNAGAPSGDYDHSKPWRPASSLQEQAMGVERPNGTRNAGDCADAVQSRIEQNWILPIGAQSAENTIIKLRIELNRDGTLLREPAVMNPAYSPEHEAMARAAVTAAIRGQPYSIPPQQYERCRDMILRFNPRDMYGN